jgi:hypothetical protein
MTTMPTWEALFGALKPEEQTQAMLAFWRQLRQDEALKKTRKELLDALAQSLRFRPQRMRTLPDERIAGYCRQHCGRIFLPADWHLLFICFYIAERAPLMAAFLDALGMEHGGDGVMQAETDPVPVERLVDAATALTGQHGAASVAHYLGVLHRMEQRTWANAGEALSRLPPLPAEDAAVATVAAEAVDSPTQEHEPETTLVLDQFTTLDRVLIDQVLATVAEEEGCLRPDQLEDLIENVVALNGKRRRSVFHLGFMHGLLPGRELELHRPEYNERRRGWYLAGALAAKTRQRDRDAVRDLLAAHAEDFRAAAETPKSAGAVMANMLLDTLFEFGHANEALLLLKGQLAPGAINLTRSAYRHATTLLRQQQPDAALPVLRLLRERLPQMSGDPAHLEPLRVGVERRYGQCLQSNGDLDGSRAIFEAILNRVEDGNRPDLRADLGLIAGGFRSLDRLHLPEDQSERNSMRAALSRGEAHFRAAVDGYGEHAANACYALAVRDYLFWADEAKDDAEVHASALKHVEMALIGMRESESAGAYAELGLLGQSLFMNIVLNMHRLVEGESHKALAQWERIPGDAGMFPKQDVQHLLTAADLLNPRVAAQIAESVWRKRNGGEAWEILGGSAERLIEHSSYLEAELLSMARDAASPRAYRFRIWKLLVAVFLRTGRNELAEEGLDALESLSEEPALARLLLDWLHDSAHYDPVWSENDADWARVRSARGCGRDDACVAPLMALFYRLRDVDANEAARTAQLLIDWRLNPDTGHQLLAGLPDRHHPVQAAGIEARLREAEPVSILFVGGNEIQARYDASILDELAERWPGVQVHFEHTGWSSNWGREVDRLVRRANQCDAVVIMRMIRTILGRTLREKVQCPWVACTGTGRGMMLQSIQEAAALAVKLRE